MQFFHVDRLELGNSSLFGTEGYYVLKDYHIFLHSWERVKSCHSEYLVTFGKVNFSSILTFYIFPY